MEKLGFDEDEKLLSDAAHHLIVGIVGVFMAIFVTISAYVCVDTLVLPS
jgi:hypothetical protein